MGFDNFELIENSDTVKCKTCQAIIPKGVISISEHWVNCTGKDFNKAIMDNAKQGKKLTLDVIDEMRKIYLNNSKKPT